VAIQIEDHYWDATDAAVVFRREDRWSGDVRYIYHGNDGTSMPWNDTAQLDYLKAEVREAVESELKKEVEEMVAAIQRAAPVSDFESRPGELRDSVTAYPVQGRPAAWRIIVKAQDKKGRYYCSYVEFGHNTKDGGRVPAQPFFWPSLPVLGWGHS
jgi:hypothetical protein